MGMIDIISAIKDDNYLVLKELLKKGEDPNQLVEISEDEYAPILFYALRYRVDLDLIKLLIENGADINYLSDDGVGVLDEAVVFGKIETIKYLLNDLGMDVNSTKRKSGMTPFMQACCYGDLELISYIKECGADINKRDNNGMNALDYAKKLGQKKVKDFLEKIIE